MSKLILASASPRREELLTMLGLNFTTVPSKVDEEEFTGLLPEQLVQKLAREKVEEVAALVEDTIVIGADTVVVFDGKVLGKPEDQQDAIRMLTELQGRKHSVYTGIAVYGTNSNKLLIDYDRTDVFFRKMDEAEIKGYVKTDEPMDKAGAYGIQGIGGIFVERIDGSYFTVMGLPIHKLMLMLKEFDITIF
jgi:septum formation protein